MKMAMHVICFDVPYPASYGGVIDVFYKLKELKNAGVYIYLHVFTYGNRNEEKQQLLKVADEVFYYPRKTGLFSNLHFNPYIVFSRRNKMLLNNLLENNYPIFFEGIHSCYLLASKELRNRVKWVRSHNVEHEYYKFLMETSTSLWKKAYYFVESHRLRIYERNLKYANKIFAITTADKHYFERHFPMNNVELLPCFINSNKKLELKDNLHSAYFLYHGNLAVAENQKAVNYLIERVVPLIDKSIKLKIAGRNPPKSLIECIHKLIQVEIIANPTDIELDLLIANAKANILVTFQPTGIKLKLLNALYNGGFCIVNSIMLQGTDLQNLCIVADSPEEINGAIENVLHNKFTVDDRDFRLKQLSKYYSNEENVKVILKALGS